jgi:hypothetical protein
VYEIFKYLTLDTNLDNLIKVTSILVTIISTYFVTKYTSNNSRRLEIKQKQFDKVYLPVYRLIKKDMGRRISKEKALEYGVRMKSILLKNYEYAYPQLHNLHYSLMFSIQTKGNYQIDFNKISYQVNLEYNLLKKSLGYPSENFVNLFIRMNLKDKINFILGWINFICIILGPFIFAFFFQKYLIWCLGGLIFLIFVNYLFR